MYFMDIVIFKDVDFLKRFTLLHLVNLVVPISTTLYTVNKGKVSSASLCQCQSLCITHV